MQESYEYISHIWLDFPKDFENLDLHDYVTKLKNIFEENKLYFDNYITKIIIIGNVSVGKSTLMNSLIGKEYFQTEPEHGTDDVDHNSFYKVYIKKNLTELLQKKTALVDCPGLGQIDYCDELINLHCSNSDKIIFLFNYNNPATPMQSKNIKRVSENLKKFKNPSYLFVYNKCDEFNFDDDKLTSLRVDFCDRFKNQYHESSKSNDDPLFFISARNPKMGKDFERLKDNLLAHINNNYLRFLKVKAMLFREISTFKDKLKTLISSMTINKMNLSKKLAEMDKESNDLNKQCTTLINYVRNMIVECKKDFQVEKIFEYVIEKVNSYNGTCTKHDAYKFIMELSGFIDKEISKYLVDLLDKNYISMINNKIKDVNKGKFDEIIKVENIKPVNDNNSFMKTSMKLNIFWPHESGTKTDKVKLAYIKYLEKTHVKVEIIEKISKIYNDHLLTIQTYLGKSIKCSRTKNKEIICKLKENCESEEIKLTLLEDYEKKILDFIRKYETILVKYVN